jgi:glycosyltransferase involved in cell wall biosynthesis
MNKEIIIVDDASSDRTRDILRQLEEVEGIRLILKERNEGKGAALRDGFAMAKGDILVVQDADLEYDPRDLPALLKPIIDGQSDVVFGSRYLNTTKQDSSWIHRCGNWVLTEASNLFTGIRLTDMETCYKAFRREVLKDIAIKQNRFGVEPEMTAKIARRGYRISEVPIEYHARGYDEGKKIGLKDLFKAVYCIVRYGISD